MKVYYILYNILHRSWASCYAWAVIATNFTCEARVRSRAKGLLIFGIFLKNYFFLRTKISKLQQVWSSQWRLRCDDKMILPPFSPYYLHAFIFMSLLLLVSRAEWDMKVDTWIHFKSSNDRNWKQFRETIGLKWVS